MPAANYVLGMKAGLYIGPADTFTPDTMTELAKIKDATLSLEAGEADISTRDNDGWEATAPTLRSCSLEFELLWTPGDANFVAIRDAFLNSTEIALAALDQKRTVVGAQGPVGNFTITNFSRNESLTEAITVSVTAKLSKFDEWHTVPEPEGT